MKKILILLLALSVLLILVGITTPFSKNLWYKITAQGYIIPSESSWLTFSPTMMNAGSGEWWVYGQDLNNYYYIGDETNSPYVTYRKEEAVTCSGFMPTDYATWCNRLGQ